MLPVVFFLGFWVILGVGLFFVAARGGLGGARAAFQTQSRRGRKSATIVFAFVFAGLGVSVPVALLLGNRDRASAQVAGVKLSAGDKRGREIFGNSCGACHTLAAADAVGKVGPNLDVLKPPKALILDALVNGRQRGNGTMPAALLPNATDRADVADFVAKVEGK